MQYQFSTLKRKCDISMNIVLNTRCKSNNVVGISIGCVYSKCAEILIALLFAKYLQMCSLKMCKNAHCIIVC